MGTALVLTAAPGSRWHPPRQRGNAPAAYFMSSIWRARLMAVFRRR